MSASNSLLMGRAVEFFRGARIVYDTSDPSGPKVGECLQTIRGRTYRVIKVRRVKCRAGNPLYRYALETERVEPDLASDVKWSLKWNPRSKRRKPVLD